MPLLHLEEPFPIFALLFILFSDLPFSFPRKPLNLTFFWGEFEEKA
jgi:hypothetical protein